MCSFPLFTRKPKDDSVCLSTRLLPNLQIWDWVTPGFFWKEHPVTFSNTLFWINSASSGCYRKLKKVAINFFKLNFFHARQRWIREANHSSTSAVDVATWMNMTVFHAFGGDQNVKILKCSPTPYPLSKHLAAKNLDGIDDAETAYLHRFFVFFRNFQFDLCAKSIHHAWDCMMKSYFTPWKDEALL